MEALIIYYSKERTTRRFAEAIAYQVGKRLEDIKVRSIEEVTPQDIIDSDILYLGCWTSGMFFGQKPEKPWTDFVSQLPAIEGKRTVLFTTYKIRTGNMFRRMKEHLAPKGYRVIGCMKSRNAKFDYFSNGVLRYSLYQLVTSQVSENIQYVPNELGVLEMA
jgi:flavodoxin